MRTPIAYGLGYPERIASAVKPLSLIEVAKLEFEAPDTQRFPCLTLAYDALAAGGTAPAMLNAANEVAVDAFLRDSIGYLDIPRLIDHTLQALPVEPVASIEQLLAVDAQARAHTQQLISAMAASPARKVASV
jgi:1-deoxy-D-xylulose-5-phosphate reductoisomerase